MDDMNNTVKFSVEKEKDIAAKDVIMGVYNSLEEKGYNSINQFVGYILSGDPTYITSHNNARSLIRKLERDEILEELLKFYLENNK